MRRKIIVFGATGKTGKHICLELESRKIPYAVFVREQSKESITGTPEEIIVGDVFNSADVARVFDKDQFSDVIISLGSRDRKSIGIREYGTKNIIEALKKQATGSAIHVISALGAGESWDQLGTVAKFICRVFINRSMKDHTLQENLVINSPYPYHIIRPVGLKDGTSKGVVHVQDAGLVPSNFVERVDVARYTIDSLMNDHRGFSAVCEST